jgi:hypothetical protein
MAKVSKNGSGIPRMSHYTDEHNHGIKGFDMGDGAPRALGLVMLFVGACLGFLCVLLPLRSMEDNSSTIFLSKIGAAVVPAAFIYGSAYTAFGLKAHEAFHRNGKFTILGFIVALVAVMGGIMLYIAMREHAQNLGYMFKRS